MNFKSKAAQHQELFRSNYLKLPLYDTYTTMLTDSDATLGYNFYLDFPGMMEAVKRRYRNFNKPLYKNMLRSEHIPFNFFVPLQLHINEAFVLAFFRELFPKLDILKLLSIDIEYSPETRRNQRRSCQSLPITSEQPYLNDNTSFDVFVTYQSPIGQEAIGIEIKYTEKSYPYDAKEKELMFSPTHMSLYHKRHANSGIYMPNTIPKLREKKLKQLWRNHLLGLSMVENGDILKFTSMHLYPDGNTYQENAATEYAAFLREDCKDTFVPMTFEMFIVIGQEVFYGLELWNRWLKYLEKRYVF